MSPSAISALPVTVMPKRETTRRVCDPVVMSKRCHRSSVVQRKPVCGPTISETVHTVGETGRFQTASAFSAKVDR